MAHNKLSDLRDHMFASLERLSDESLSEKEIQNEVDKAKAIAGIGSVIINSAKLEIDYLKATGKIDTQSDLFKSVISTKSIE
jgi:hypothetical protein